MDEITSGDSPKEPPKKPDPDAGALIEEKPVDAVAQEESDARKAYQTALARSKTAAAAEQLANLTFKRALATRNSALNRLEEERKNPEASTKELTEAQVVAVLAEADATLEADNAEKASDEAYRAELEAHQAGVEASHQVKRNQPKKPE